LEPESRELAYEPVRRAEKFRNDVAAGLK
jgi:hypothetical protein